VKRLTKKQAKLARERVKNPDATLSELSQRSAYHDKATAARELKKPHVQERIKDLMDARPALKDDALLKKLEEGLEAGKTEFFPHEVTTGFEKVLDAEGKEILDSKGKPKLRAVKTLEIVTRDCIDYPTRHRYLDTALDLKGHKQKKVDVTSNGETIKALLLEDD